MPDAEIDRAAAALLTVGFAGAAVNDAVMRLLDRGVSGVILFSRNLRSKAEVAELVQSLKSYAGRPIFIAVDQEGGVVQRLRDGFARVPPMRALGSIDDEALAESVGRVLASQLRSVGIDVNFAPVLDVDTNPDNPVIGNRALSHDQQVVARLGVALGRGLEAGGVAACGKHFPGHGDTTQDSHLQLPRLEHTMERLREVELVPFRAWCAAQLSSVMTAHVVFSPLDEKYPATMSDAVLRGILRDELKYQGLVFSDDLEMRAILDHFGPREAAERGLRAGVDNFLCCHTAAVAHEIIDALADCAQSSDLMRERLLEAERRVARFTARWAKPSVDAGFGPFPGTFSDKECLRVVDEVIARADPGKTNLGTDPTEGCQPSATSQEQDQQ